MSKKIILFLFIFLLNLTTPNGNVYAHDCLDGNDNDGDGQIDYADSDCEGEWTSLTPMPTARNASAAAAINDLIFVFGGRSSESPQNNLNLVEVYSILNETWLKYPNFEEGRQALMAEVLDNKIYVMGGLYNTNNNSIFDVKNSVEVFNLDTGEWSYVKSMNVPRWSASSVVFNGEIFVTGGSGTFGVNAISSFEKYNPKFDSWVSLDPMSSPRSSHGSAVLNGQIYVVGGIDNNGNPLNTVEVYDIQNNSWKNITPLPVSIITPGVEVVGDSLFVYGGYTRSSSGSNYINDIYEYDFHNNEWLVHKSLSVKVAQFSTVSYKDKLYKIGGASYSGSIKFHDEVEVYTPSLSEGIIVNKDIEDLVAELEEKVGDEVSEKSLFQSYVAHIKNILPFYEKLNYQAAKNQVKALVRKFSNDTEQEKLDGELGDELIELGEQVDEILNELQSVTSRVPLVTQIASIFPPESASWADDVYAFGDDYWCGSTIAGCGCAISSLSMLALYHGLASGIDDSEINPGNLNQWLIDNNGYSASGGVIWNYALQYFSPKAGYSNLSFDHHNAISKDLIDSYVEDKELAIAFSAAKGHYFILSEVLDGGGYEVRDPFWYETKTTNDAKDVGNNVQDYNDVIDQANLFSFSNELKPLPAWIEIHLGSPAELLLVDGEGNKAGYDPDTSEVVLDIPGSSYSQAESPVTKDDTNGVHMEKILMVQKPKEGEYNLSVIGTGEGEYNLSIASSGGMGEYKIEHYKENVTLGEIDGYVIGIDLVDQDSGHGNENGCDEDNQGTLSGCVI